MDPHPKRSFVMQILRLLVWAVIAVALVKFAFFPQKADIPEMTGDGNFTLPTVTVEKGDISHEISLDASVIRDESKPVKSTASGEIVWLYVEDGQNVGQGAPILQVMHTEVSEPTDPEEQPVETTTYHDVYAPADGTLSLDALIGQQVEIGTEIGTVVPSTFHAQVPVTPEQLYSLQGIPEEAQIAVTGGPAPFTCTGLHTITQAPEQKAEGTDTSGGPQLRCAIPPSELVFDGVKAKLLIQGGSASGVLLAPVTAVEGRYQEGNVYLPVDNIGDKPEKVTVKLGVSDGSMIEIKEGLSEGQEILEFVPRQDSDEPQDEMMG